MPFQKPSMRFLPASAIFPLPPKILSTMPSTNPHMLLLISIIISGKFLRSAIKISNPAFPILNCVSGFNNVEIIPFIILGKAVTIWYMISGNASINATNNFMPASMINGSASIIAVIIPLIIFGIAATIPSIISGRASTSAVNNSITASIMVGIADIRKSTMLSIIFGS
ncbi:hypothetical protein SDC9_171506 [bioreactor metagenome]|uniref:Uncharacterized protein n=1 Tax=bioreactor metagenome TaxID=1076179 RepID=A0A645GDM5_9ZZZZ